jgi:hypothetical protein
MNQKLEIIGQSAYSFKETLYHSYHTAIEVIEKNIDGDLVECGVAMGSQIGAFQLALVEKQALNRKIWAFDSFEGIPLAGEFDTEQAGIGEITHNKFAPIQERLVSSGITAHSLESVIQNFKTWDLPIHNVEFVKGWFQNTIEEKSKSIKNISVLRLDGDLHESTLICLQHLYPKVVIGGIVIIDDYALTGCKIAVEQYFESIKESLPIMNRVDGSNSENGVVFFIKN